MLELLHLYELCRSLQDDTYNTFDVEDVNWREDARGAAGVEVKLQLTLRVVADVGLVGLPNAGKSSLLTCMTQATPEIANYPFTTLMPNLGVMQVGGDQELSKGGDRVVLADMPGLIEGAHQVCDFSPVANESPKILPANMFLKTATEAIIHHCFYVVRSIMPAAIPTVCEYPHS